MDAQHNTNMTSLYKIIKLAGKEKTDKLIAKGASNPMIRVAIAGILTAENQQLLTEWLVEMQQLLVINRA